MRDVGDEDGREWDVTAGRESWGALVLLFSLRKGREVRTSMLPVETMLEAEQFLADLSVDELRDRLASSQPWE